MSYRKNDNNPKKGGNEPWRNRERHYCEVCNAWMSSDLHSIRLHENGKKHKENLAKFQLQQRQDRAKEEKQALQIQNALKSMEAAALQSHVQDIGHFTHGASAAPATPAYMPPPHASPPPQGNAQNDSILSKRQIKQEREEWESRKKHRQEEKSKQRGGDDADEDETAEQAQSTTTKQIGEDEGYYTVGNVKLEKEQDGNSKNKAAATTTYLEGVVFGDLLEEDMPIQLWTGSNLASDQEMRLVGKHHLWVDALVLAVRQRKGTEHANRMVVDVAFLSESKTTNNNDEGVKKEEDEETLEKSVPLRRLRIVLGADDEKIPKTLEEARIMAMGGEHKTTTTDSNKGEETVDEATGFSGWSTVSVKRTTVRQELKEERARLRQARKEAAAKAEQEQKAAEFRRMEETKVANADDSALGAYDVWSRGQKEGYKGVNIHQETKIGVADRTQKLATTGNVAFKKSAFQKKKKKQSRRTTSADD